MTLAEAADKIHSLQPDLVGITLMGYTSIPPGAAFIRTLKKETRSGFSVIAGGHGAAGMPEPILEAGADCVCFGEGELTLQQIIGKGISPGMPGTFVLENNRLVKGPVQTLISPLDHLNEPARDLMPPPFEGIHLMETSRGCPHRCEFCESTRFYGLRWRSKSPERVVQEVNRIIDEYSGWVIQFADDNFAASIKRVKEICKKLVEEDAVPAYFTLSARGDDLIADPDLLPMMADARMLRFNIGIDTLDADVGKTVRKTVPTGVYRKTFARMRELGMFSVGSFIVGLPGETAQARERAVELAVEAAPDSAHFLPYIPLPGLLRDAKHTGVEPHPDDIEACERFTKTFFRQPSVLANLKELAERDGIQGQLAIGTLKKIQNREQHYQD